MLLDHKLRLVVHLDIDLSSACVEILGCLTRAACPCLVKVLARGRRLNHDLKITLDLRNARHIDAEALEFLQCLDTEQPKTLGRLDDVGVLTVLLPAALPLCRAALITREPATRPPQRSRPMAAAA